MPDDVLILDPVIPEGAPSLYYATDQRNEAADLSGNSRDGILNGSPVTSATTTIFDGVDDSISTGYLTRVNRFPNPRLSAGTALARFATGATAGTTATVTLAEESTEHGGEPGKSAHAKFTASGNDQIAVVWLQGVGSTNDRIPATEGETIAFRLRVHVADYPTVSPDRLPRMEVIFESTVPIESNHVRSTGAADEVLKAAFTAPEGTTRVRWRFGWMGAGGNLLDTGEVGEVYVCEPVCEVIGFGEA